LSSQIKAFVNAEAGGADNVNQYLEGVVNEIVALNISPFGAPFIMQIINVDIPNLLYCIFFFSFLFFSFF
jgi:hypothetical protein